MNSDISKKYLVSIYKNINSVSLYAVFIALAIYTIRFRPGNFYLFAIENLFFLVGIFSYPWTKAEIFRLSKFTLLLMVYASVTLFIYYPSYEDLLITIISSMMLIKCIIFCYYIYKLRAEVVYQALKIVYLICLAAQFLVLLDNKFTIDINSGFNGLIGDRNYLSIMNISFLYTILTIKKFINKNSVSEELTIYLIAALTIITVGLSYSRSGLLGIIFVISFFYYKNIYLWLIVLLAYLSGLFDHAIGRFSFTENSNEMARINQYLVFIELLKTNSINFIFGFGPMASEHLYWLGKYYKKIGISGGITVMHNSFVEIFLSFGFIGLMYLIKIIKNLPWHTIMLIIILGSFNNVIIFLPFYICIGVAMQLESESKRIAL